MGKPRLQLIPKDSVQTRQTLKNTLVSTVSSILIFAVVFMTTTVSDQPLDDVFFTMNTPEHVVACGEAETFEIEYINTSGYALTGQEISISLPEGISYVAGSVIDTSGHNVTEDDISDLSNIIFTLDDVDDGGSVQFSIQYQANVGAITTYLTDNALSNTVSLTTNEGVSTQESDNYKVLYASLNISSVNPVSQSISAGDTTTRTLTITNTGSGKLSAFYITDANGTGIEISSTDHGSLNNSRDTIYVSGSDFTSIGNGDEYFDSTETLTITETIVATGCSDTTITSEIKAEWGCAGNKLTNSVTNASISTALKTPYLSITSTANLETCFGSGFPNTQQIKLKNSGQGVATQVKLDIFKSTGGEYNQDIFSAIDTSSISWQIGTAGNPVHISPGSVTNTKSDGNYSCLGSNAIGQFLLNLPNIEAGEEIIIKWNTVSCCVDASNNEYNTGWKYQVSYSDACEQNPVAVKQTGEYPKSANISVFAESPSDIKDQQTEAFIFTISSFQNQYPTGVGAHYEVVFDIPTGLEWSGNNSDLSFVSGLESWTPSTVNFNESQRKLTVKYPLPAPFTLPKSELGILLSGNCAAASGQNTKQTIGLNINYIADNSCNSTCGISLLRDEEVSVDLHCESNCTEGMDFYGYDIVRTSFGSPDNDQDGLPDNGGSLNMSLVKSKRAMVGDTLKGTFYGVVKGNSPWNYAYGSSAITSGANLTAIGATVRVYDASSATYISCDAVSYAGIISGDDQNFSFDMSPSVLGVSCAAFSNFQYAEGDSIWLYTDYVVSGNIGNKVQVADISSNFYLSHTANPGSEADQYQCDSWGGKFTLIGYFFQSEAPKQFDISGCSDIIQQDFNLSIGDCCSNFHGGNLFPYEYRNWAHLKEAYVVIPAHYEVIDISFEQRRTKHTNASVTESVEGIQADSIQGDTLWFDLEKYYELNGGTITLSDDGFKSSIYLEIAPTCKATANSWQDIIWKYTFIEADHLSGEETAWKDAQPGKVRFSPPTLALSSPEPTIESTSQILSWTLDIENTSSTSGSDNTWIHVKSPSGNIYIDKIIDKSTGDTLQLTGDIYQIGQVTAGTNRQFEIRASYSSCSADFIEVYTGFECAAYPATFEEFNCPYSQLELHATMQPAELQAKVISDGGSCNSETGVVIELTGAQAAHVNDIEIAVKMPINKALKFRNGSAQLKFPTSGSYVTLPDPTVAKNSFTYKLEDLNTYLAENGLPGISIPDSNKLHLKFEADFGPPYKQGDFIEITISSQKPCGEDLPEISLIYDPSSSYISNPQTGLDIDQGDSWSVSWADYDDDGYDDAYVTEYRHWKASYLYHNNGDGTFTKVNPSTGPLVRDKGSATGSTWGDFDNDGDIDLFVASNVRAINVLYENTGTGKFKKAKASDTFNYGTYCHNASWVDYDNDGHLDLFISDYFPTKFNQLYHNNGDATFTRDVDNPIAMEAKYSMGATRADYDNDGLQDLFVPNGKNENNSLYHNDGNGQFTKILDGDIVNDGGNSVGCSWGDYDNDGDMDLYVANAGDQDNFFYVNNGDGTFTRNTSALIANEGGHSHGSGWADIDNDGDLDLFVSNDADTPNRLYTNNGDGTFSRSSNPINEDAEHSRSGAFADIDNDGDLDLFVVNIGGQANTVYLNEGGNCNNWKSFKLEGIRSNRSAIGARIRIKANIYGQDVWQTREISGQTGGGSSSQSTIKAYFGLGDANFIDSVVISWPSGFEQVLTHVHVNDIQDVQEADGVEICGTVFYDLNQNCIQDNGEEGIPNVMLEVLPGPKYITTDQYGNYQLYRDYGTYTISVAESKGWVNAGSCTEIHTIEYKSANRTASSFCGNDFGLKPLCPKPDMVSFLSGTELRRGYKTTYAISYLNRGSLPAKGVKLEVTFDQDIIPISADVNWDAYTVGDSTTTYTWDLGTVPPKKQRTIMVLDSVAAEAIVGKMARVSTSVSSSTDDCNSENNDAVDYNEIISSADPNDMIVYPAGTIMPTDTLTYKIRFQNVGNAFAQRVLIKDTLPEFLDERTIEIVGNSHPYSMSLSENRVISFLFDRIYLPDSISNEPKSHGFIQYKIVPKVGTPIGSEIRNRAAIQFDYNEYIITNQTYNKVVNTLKLAKENRLRLDINPTPMVDEAYASVVSIDDPTVKVNITSMEIFTMTGTRLYAIPSLNHQEVAIRRENLSSGMYIVRVYDKNGFSHSAKMMVK